MLIQGTTPSHKFRLSISANLIKDVMITYIQDRKIIIKKTLADVFTQDNIIYVDLTQEETFLFSHDLRVRIEVRVLTNDDKVFGRVFKNIPVEELIDKEVFTT